VLFDEIEKAHPDICQLLLQILEDGHLTDNVGRTVDFRNTIIIMTSNVGAEILQKNVSLGFGSVQSADDDHEEVKSKITEEAKKVFRPEFLNRLDDLVIFRKLTKDHIKQIVELEIQKLRERVKQKGYRIRVSAKVKDFLVEKGFDEKFGARPLRRAVERHLEDTLAESILNEEIEDSTKDLLVAKLKNDEVYFDATTDSRTPVPVSVDDKSSKTKENK